MTRSLERGDIYIPHGRVSSLMAMTSFTSCAG